jgi:predicted transcriptional regulator
MSKKSIPVHITHEKLQTLKKIADLCRLDTVSLINEAIDSYIDLNQSQIKHIRKGLDQAGQGKFVSKAQVQAGINKWQD